jgi:hypothetical protein
MSFYAIGDIQGCHAEFCQLLDLIGFSPREDRLWIVGDIVNRGPDSLATLREVKALGDAAVTVLGNHDFHLLTVAAGHAKLHRRDTLAPILEAPDRDELIGWLQRRRSWSSRASGCSYTRDCCRHGRRRQPSALPRVETMLANERAPMRSSPRSMVTSHARGAMTSKGSTGCASPSMPSRGCVSALRTARWSSTKARARDRAGGLSAMVPPRSASEPASPSSAAIGLHWS